MKTCTKCKIEKEASDFGKDKRAKDGLQSRCRKCATELNKANIARNSKLPCVVDGCTTNRSGGNKLCGSHRNRKRAFGDPLLGPPIAEQHHGVSVAERFFAWTVLPDNLNECWAWRGSTNSQGYAHLGVDGKMQKAYRIALNLCGIETPSELHADHLCRRGEKGCVNPSHLELVPGTENLRRRQISHAEHQLIGRPEVASGAKALALIRAQIPTNTTVPIAA